METTWFKLKKAFEYTVVGARGRPLYRFAKGKPQAVSIPEDVRKLRAMRDHFIECDAEGNPASPAGGSQHVIARPKPLSSRAFQERPPLPARSPSRRPTAAEQVRVRPPARPTVSTTEQPPEDEKASASSEKEAAPVTPIKAAAQPATPDTNAAQDQTGNAPEAQPAAVRPANPDLPFECPDCDKRFKSEQAVGAHHRMIHEEK